MCDDIDHKHFDRRLFDENKMWWKAFVTLLCTRVKCLIEPWNGQTWVDIRHCAHKRTCKVSVWFLERSAHTSKSRRLSVVMNQESIFSKEILEPTTTNEMKSRVIPGEDAYLRNENWRWMLGGTSFDSCSTLPIFKSCLNVVTTHVDGSTWYTRRWQYMISFWFLNPCLSCPSD